MSEAPAGLAVRTQKRYGWRPDHPDMRDFLMAVEPAKALPHRKSLRRHMPAVYDQGQLGSCTANSIGAILEFNELKQAEADAATPSRLFIYYNERAMEGTVDQDSGAEIRTGSSRSPSWARRRRRRGRTSSRSSRGSRQKRAYSAALKHQAIRMCG